MEPDVLLLQSVSLLALLIHSPELFEPVQVIGQDGFPHFERLLQPIALAPFQHSWCGVSLSFSLSDTYDAELHGQAEPGQSFPVLTTAPSQAGQPPPPERKKCGGARPGGLRHTFSSHILGGGRGAISPELESAESQEVQL